MENGEWKLLLILSAWPLLYGSERRRALFIRRLLSPTPLKYVWIAWASVARQSFDLILSALRRQPWWVFKRAHARMHTRTHANTNTPVKAGTNSILLKINENKRRGRVEKEDALHFSLHFYPFTRVLMWNCHFWILFYEIAKRELAKHRIWSPRLCVNVRWG